MLFDKFETNLRLTGPAQSMKQEVSSWIGSITWNKVLAQFREVILAPGEHLARERHWVVRDIGYICSYINRKSDADQQERCDDLITPIIGHSSVRPTHVEFCDKYLESTQIQIYESVTHPRAARAAPSLS